MLAAVPGGNLTSERRTYLDPTVEQRATLERYRRLHPGHNARLGKRDGFMGLCAILAPRLDPRHAPMLDQEGYLVRWTGVQWCRVGADYDPPQLDLEASANAV